MFSVNFCGFLSIKVEREKGGLGAKMVKIWMISGDWLVESRGKKLGQNYRTIERMFSSMVVCS